MEGLFVLLGLTLLAVPVLLIVALAMISGLRHRVDALERELGELQVEAAARGTSPDGTPEKTLGELMRESPPRPASPPPSTEAPPSPPVPLQSKPRSTPASATASVSATPPAASTRPPAPAVPSRPDPLQLAARAMRRWFTEGNVPVKVGVLVLLFGVAAALRLAVANGYLQVSIEARLAAIAGGALLGLALGWRERLRKPAFALSLQGGAIGVLLLTVFAAYRLYGLVPAGPAFALVVVLVAGSAVLALLQRAMALAVLGFLGGYLAPVLISTGSANHVALFSYYAVLNAAVFAISWRQSWRLLNLIGFFFTFGVGTAWGARYYRPELFASVEPFLVLFFAFYLAIGLMYVLRQTEHRRPWVDGTLVFGTPLVAFPLQAAMLKDDRMALAFSAVVVALVYVGMMAWLRRQRGERLLTEAYGALAMGFATLAVPLAFSAGTTASLWALEGAGVAWLGLRQQRRLPWIAGLLLQALAAIAYLASFKPGAANFDSGWLLLNSQWLGAAIIAFSGFALALIHDRHAPRYGLPALLFAWAIAWWAIAGITQWDDARATALDDWRFSAIYLGLSALLAIVLSRRLAWPRLEAMTAVVALCGFALVPWAHDEQGMPLATSVLGAWAVFAGGVLAGLANMRVRTGAAGVAHLAWLWTLAFAATLQVHAIAEREMLAQGWRFLALVAPVALMTLALWRRPRLAAWPRSEAFAGYRSGWVAPAAVLLAGAFFVGLLLAGDAHPLAFLPVLNPLDLSLVGIGVLLYALAAPGTQLAPLREAWPLPALALVTMATLRAVHHLHGEPWSLSLLDSGFSQASLTLVWSLIGVSAWILGSRRRDRGVWMGGAVLMGIVLLKLLVVDRGYMGNLPGIVSFMAVGLLLVGVGYVAPSPPRTLPREAGA